MPRNSSGVYSLPQAPFTPSSVISSTAVNSDLSDIASALTGSVASSGVTTITAPIKNPTGTAAAPGVSFASFTDTGLYVVSSGILGLAAGGVAVAYIDTTKVGTGQTGNQLYYANTAIPSPVGSVIDFAGTSAPTGWLLCFGQSLLRTDYPELFTVIGTTYGAADGTHFSMPDCRGRASFGRDNMGGVAAGNLTAFSMTPDGNTLNAIGGAQAVSLVTSNLPAYTPTGSIVFSSSGTNIYTPAGTISSVDTAFTNFFYTSGGSTGNQVSAQGAPAFSGTPVTVTFSGAAQGGASTGLNKLSPAIIFNKIIFAGRP